MDVFRVTKVSYAVCMYMHTSLLMRSLFLCDYIVASSTLFFLLTKFRFITWESSFHYTHTCARVLFECYQLCCTTINRSLNIILLFFFVISREITASQLNLYSMMILMNFLFFIFITVPRKILLLLKRHQNR